MHVRGAVGGGVISVRLPPVAANEPKCISVRFDAQLAQRLRVAALELFELKSNQNISVREPKLKPLGETISVRWRDKLLWRPLLKGEGRPPQKQFDFGSSPLCKGCAHFGSPLRARILVAAQSVLER